MPRWLDSFELLSVYKTSPQHESQCFSMSSIDVIIFHMEVSKWCHVSLIFWPVSHHKFQKHLPCVTLVSFHIIMLSMTSPSIYHLSLSYFALLVMFHVITNYYQLISVRSGVPEFIYFQYISLLFKNYQGINFHVICNFGGISVQCILYHSDIIYPLQTKESSMV